VADGILPAIAHALFFSAGMFWQVLWSLVLGFLISAIVQAVVSKEQMTRVLGRNGVREVALATGFGAASSSCSYAAAAVSKSLFKKGAGLLPSLAFLFSSTNLVIELGLILIVLMGWQFAAAEWIGGVLLVVLMSLLVKATYPAKLVEEARVHVDEAHGHEHGSSELAGATIWDRLRDPRAPVAIAQNFWMDVSMLWKDLLIGFLIAGAITAFVPVDVWRAVFGADAPESLRPFIGVLVGPLIAIFTFVCSIGNVPMAAALWAGGISFGGVLAFLYADLIVLPLLDIYRRYYGWRMAAYLFAVFFVTMVLAALIMEFAFGALGLVPMVRPHFAIDASTFSLNYTFWLNIIFASVAIYLYVVDARNPMDHGHHHDMSHHAEPS
jgi:uncharacterized membrane protein YraQ (UPF0718 family)